MPDNQLPLPIARPHNNQQLCSDYYLDMERMAEIVRLETELNARVYAMFGLIAAEIGVEEETTNYRSREV